MRVHVSRCQPDSLSGSGRGVLDDVYLKADSTHYIPYYTIAVSTFFSIIPI